MKTKFLNFGGGLVTGLMLYSIFATIPAQDKPMTRAGLVPDGISPRIRESRYVEVPIKEFFGDVARYRVAHLGKLPKPPSRSGNELHSRMFTYNVDVLEDFFVTVKALAAEADIPSDEVAIRFYYGVYPLNTRIAGQNYSSLHTLFMVPNHWNSRLKRFVDIDMQELADSISSAGGYGNNDKNREEVIKHFYLENMYQRDNSSTAFILDASAFDWVGTPETASVFPSFAAPPVINQGQLCPPNCQTNSLLTYIDSKPTEFPGTP